MARKLKLNWATLNTRIAVAWRPDPHKRGGPIASKLIYKRKPRTPLRGFHFIGAGY